MHDSKIWYSTSQSLKKHAYVTEKDINGTELGSSSMSLCGINPQESIPDKNFTILELINEVNIDSNEICDKCLKSLKKIISKLNGNPVNASKIKSALAREKDNCLLIYQYSILNGVEHVSWEIELKDLSKSTGEIDINKLSNFIAEKLFIILSTLYYKKVKSSFSFTKPVWIYLNYKGLLIEFNPKKSEELDISIICKKGDVITSVYELQKIIEFGLSN